MICAVCGKRKATNGCLCEDCTNRDIRLTDSQYEEALIRFRHYISGGGPIWAFDSEEIGNKDTQCSWGLCCRTPGMWPNPQDHMWPHSFVTEKRVAPKYQGPGQMCPMDKREPGETFGCFFSCRIFQGPKPTREEAVRLYDLSLERLHNEKVT